MFYIFSTLLFPPSSSRSFLVRLYRNILDQDQAWYTSASSLTYYTIHLQQPLYRDESRSCLSFSMKTPACPLIPFSEPETIIQSNRWIVEATCVTVTTLLALHFHPSFIVHIRFSYPSFPPSGGSLFRLHLCVESGWAVRLTFLGSLAHSCCCNPPFFPLWCLRLLCLGDLSECPSNTTSILEAPSEQPAILWPSVSRSRTDASISRCVVSQVFRWHPRYSGTLRRSVHPNWQILVLSTWRRRP